MRRGSAPDFLALLQGAGVVWLCLLACASPVPSQNGSQVESRSVTDADTEDADPLFDDIFDDEFDDPPTGYPDSFERTNRGVFAFNQQVDRWLLDPLTRGYQFLFPKPARAAISRFFLNLSSTKVLANDLLQLEWQDAGVTTARLVVNTTVGLVGLFDVAQRWGLERHDSGFGQTLALAGTPSGPYLILPIFGPSTVRDGYGAVIDGFFQPTYYFLGPATLMIGPTEILIYSGTSGLSTRERHLAELKALEDSSIDFYAALRSAYYQNRVAAIWGRRDRHRTSEEPGRLSAADWQDEAASTDEAQSSP